MIESKQQNLERLQQQTRSLRYLLARNRVHSAKCLIRFPFFAVEQKAHPNSPMDCQISPNRRKVWIRSAKNLKTLGDLDFCSQIPIFPDE